MQQSTPKFQEEYSAKIPALALRPNAGWQLSSRCSRFLTDFSFDKIWLLPIMSATQPSRVLTMRNLGGFFMPAV